MAETQNKLPGFGLPLDYTSHVQSDSSAHTHMYPNCASITSITNEENALLLLTLRELEMMRYMNEITDEEDWDVKIHNPSQISFWRTSLQRSNPYFSDLMFEYCMDELRWKSRGGGGVSKDKENDHSGEERETGNPPPVAVFDADVIKHDRALPGVVHEALRGALDAYEASLPQQQHHTNPMEGILNPITSSKHATKRNLIDPSDYPLIFGKSLVLPDGKVGLQDCVRRAGEGVVVPRPSLGKGEDGMDGVGGDAHADIDEGNGDYSLNYQWLPCSVDISGTEARITSYIPSIHPSNATLYTLLSSLLTHTIPLFESCLSALHPVSPHNPKINLKAERRIPYDFVTYSNEPDSDDPDLPQQEEDEDEDEYQERRREYVRERRAVDMPEPDSRGFVGPVLDGEGREMGRLDFRKMYGTTGLQVVVRVSHVCIQPGDEGMGEEEWHVEGILNEHITATAIYVYTLSNLTGPPSIGFKHQFSVESIAMIDHAAEDYEHNWLEPIFGLSLDDDVATQTFGSVKASEGRLIVFPNILQSQFQFGDLKLEDPTKSGTFKYIALHLINPTIPILSTAHVPCQNREWWFDDVLRLQGRTSRLLRLPKELLRIIGEYVDGFMLDSKEAQEVRRRVDDERELFARRLREALEGNRLVCDH